MQRQGEAGLKYSGICDSDLVPLLTKHSRLFDEHVLVVTSLGLDRNMTLAFYQLKLTLMHFKFGVCISSYYQNEWVLLEMVKQKLIGNRKVMHSGLQLEQS